MTVRSMPVFNGQPVTRSDILTRHAVNSGVLALLYGLKFNSGISADFHCIMNNIQPFFSAIVNVGGTVDRASLSSYLQDLEYKGFIRRGRNGSYSLSSKGIEAGRIKYTSFRKKFGFDL